VAITHRTGPSMNNRPGISGDIRPVRRPVGLRSDKPLPPGMPARSHHVPPRVSPIPASRPGRRQKVWEFAQYPLVAVVALAAAANADLGQLLVLIYGVVIVGWRLPSKQVFVLALVLLVSVPIFQVLSLPGISENAAIYVYELLVVGTIRAILELSQVRSESSDVTRSGLKEGNV
jgi:hypothetical protein